MPEPWREGWSVLRGYLKADAYGIGTCSYDDGET